MNKIIKIVAIAIGSIWVLGFIAGIFLEDTETTETTSTPEPTPVTNTIVEPSNVTEEMIVNKSIRILDQYYTELGYNVNKHVISMYNPERKISMKMFNYEKKKNNEHWFFCATRLTKDNKYYLAGYDIIHEPDLSNFTIDPSGNSEINELDTPHSKSDYIMGLYLQEYTD
mgnify:CR=1 FL=1